MIRNWQWPNPNRPRSNSRENSRRCLGRKRPLGHSPLHNLTAVPLTTKPRITNFYLPSPISHLLSPAMKSAYELAMERLNKTSPTVKLTAEQKEAIAELESKCAAKIAERELFIKGEI